MSDHREEEELQYPDPSNAGGLSFARQRTENEPAKPSEALESHAEELDGQREWFRVTLASIGDAVVVTDEAGAVCFMNAAAERLTGWSGEEGQGRPFNEVVPLFHEITGEAVEDLAKEVLREGAVVALANPTVLRHREGRMIPIEDSAAPIHGEDGKLRGVVLVIHDATSKQARERELREVEWRTRAALEVGSGGAWVLDVERQVVTGDAMVARMFNVPEERCRAGEAIASFIQAIHDADRARVQAAVAEAVATGGLFKAECRTLGADGMPRWVEARARLEPKQAGLPARVVGVVLDVTARKQAEVELMAAKEQLEAASHAKDNFLAALSHELRTPLAPVLMTAAALREDQRLPADARDQLGMMERNIAVEARLIDDLLDLTRVARGKLPLHLQLCDAHALIEMAMEVVRDEAEAKEIRIEKKLEASQSGLMGDPARFQQVMWNVLRNSVKYTPHGGSVAVRTSNAKGEDGVQWLKIEVKDSGMGIEPEFLERIFQAFEQGSLTGDRRSGGLGLGLSIARGIVEMHGGTIHAKSAGAGQGATFVIDLPDVMEAPSGAGDEPEIATSEPKPGKPLRLLVVEDHRATRDVLKRLLTRAGHQVIATESVATALEAAESEEFDWVISDLGLPDGSGNDMMVQLQKRHGLRGIALSGYGMEKDLDHSRESGFVAHLVKPVDFNQLRNTLETLGSP